MKVNVEYAGSWAAGRIYASSGDNKRMSTNSSALVNIKYFVYKYIM